LLSPNLPAPSPQPPLDTRVPTLPCLHTTCLHSTAEALTQVTVHRDHTLADTKHLQNRICIVSEAS